MTPKRPAPRDVDAYIASFPPEVRAILARIRKTVRAAAPEAEEFVSYGMPAYRQAGIVAYFAAFKAHIGLYPPVQDDAKLVRDASPYAGDKGNLRFPYAAPIPYDLIARIVRQRRDANLAKAGTPRARKTTKTAAAGKAVAATAAVAKVYATSRQAAGGRRAARPRALFAAGPYVAHEMARDEAPVLQAFLDANPEYYLAVGDAPPGPDEAVREFEHLPPADWPMGRMCVLRIAGDDGRMIAMANVVSDLLVSGVWHVGLFIVATALHGRGAASAIWDALEAWTARNGARWIRLGVVAGNARAERFWARAGFVETRVREGVTLGRRVNTVRVLVKPLAGQPLADYLALVARDNPGAP